MSIIHSALKKAETEKQRKTEPLALSLDEILALAEKTAGKKAEKFSARPGVSWPLFLTSAVLGALFLLGAFGLYLSWKVQSGARPAAAPAEISKPAAKPVKPAAHKTPTSAPKDLQLTGIVEAEGSYIAMINGKLLENGDSINGAQVVQIEEKEVTLTRRGKEIVLSLH